MSTVLDEIIVGVREDLAARVQQVSLEEMKKRALAAAPARDALASLRGEVPGGGNGTIMGRNSFQRKPEDGVAILKAAIDIFKA